MYSNVFRLNIFLASAPPAAAAATASAVRQGDLVTHIICACVSV